MPHSTEDKLAINELVSRYNMAMDHLRGQIDASCRRPTGLERSPTTASW